MGRGRLSAPILLDTCALIWLGQGEPVSDQAREALDAAWRVGQPPLISPMSAWELGMLESRGRLSLTSPADRWWRRACEMMRLRVCELSPEILLHASALPGEPPRDPADRIIIATARQLGLILMTRDRKALDYAEAGHLQAVTC
ncbi:type II toxin-antitoxin system VapC family toxin [Phenylobacterium sp.]|uniref:type II toxin-antitoxin system VapC family toxin n=1 Tax=Phenylobacterium sp. TaxID=1871053 RepID=UPI002730B022|nr:type II toxin-antitoxin system VapC family toxin [Phenylobacterium sp.]MDP2215490.1 type II toxin-antitoxin system VapC family toxin [Phenylobacterium sp.]